MDLYQPSKNPVARSASNYGKSTIMFIQRKADIKSTLIVQQTIYFVYSLYHNLSKTDCIFV